MRLIGKRFGRSSCRLKKKTLADEPVSWISQTAFVFCNPSRIVRPRLSTKPVLPAAAGFVSHLWHSFRKGDMI